MLTALLVDLAVIVILLAGIGQFRTPHGARRGNLTAAAALLCALAIVLIRHRVQDVPLVVTVAVLGAALGAWVAVRVSMIQIPAMVAFQHGAGGIAAFLVSYVELTRAAGEPPTPAGVVAALLGLIVGAGTFSGSLVAAGKLANRLRQTPVVLPGHNAVLGVLTLVLAALAIWAGVATDKSLIRLVLVLLILGSAVLGVVFAMRIGGADMPVLISFLNASAGLAAALCGVAIQNRLLIACGATVAASGSILTHVMCRAMNRGLTNVFVGLRPHRPAVTSAPPVSSGSAAVALRPTSVPAKPAAPVQHVDGVTRAVAALHDARRIVIIPGYGMALADAQAEVVALGEKLAALGKDVQYAIHPVAGRMPGHMHVLLAEAEVDYGLLHELKDINDTFRETDVALIVGACDVVNPAAIQAKDTPISGMPILRADEAKLAIVCNLDERPGYSGVPNPLYDAPQTVTLFGDAKATIARLLELSH